MDRQAAIRYFNGLARAIGPDNLGMPVDATANAVNLGLAGVGYLGHKTGLLREPLALIDKPVGGSDWIAEKLGNPDDGTGAYSAGRITPLMAGMARMGGQGMVKAMDKLVAQGPASAGKAAQRGAIRVSRGPGDTPNPELVLSTSMNQGDLPNLMTKGGALELYSPSFGIKRGNVMSEFGDLALIPKLGAFDPATSQSTLFNRDAYTARYSDFSGQIAKRALAPRRVPIKGDHDSIMQVLMAPDTALMSGVQLGEMAWLRPMYEQFFSVAQQLGPEAAFDRLRSMDTNFFDERALTGLEYLYKTKGGITLPAPAQIRPEAQLRMLERTALGIRPEDLRLNEGVGLGGSSGDMDNVWHTLAVKTSPAFRSFQAYERSPLGAGLLKVGPAREAEYQQKVREKAFGDRFGWLDNEAKKEAVAMVPRGLGDLRDELADSFGPGSLQGAIATSYRNNGFTQAQMDADAPGLYKAAALARRGIQHTPSAYAELKAIGSVPVNRDSFAGAILTGGATDETAQILERLGLPYTTRAYSSTPEEDLALVNMLQRGMAAPRQPAK